MKISRAFEERGPRFGSDGRRPHVYAQISAVRVFDFAPRRCLVELVRKVSHPHTVSWPRRARVVEATWSTLTSVFKLLDSSILLTTPNEVQCLKLRTLRLAV